MPYSFAPLIGDKPVVLILGSMPGNESLKQGMYYAHKSNRFFKIMFCYFKKEYSLDASVRRQLITDNHISLYDVIKFCERENSSLDSKIKDSVPNDIEAVLAANPTIKRIILNGKKAEESYKKWFSHLKIPFTALPSTSPANASFNFDKLYSIWSAELDAELNNILLF